MSDNNEVLGRQVSSTLSPSGQHGYALQL